MAKRRRVTQASSACSVIGGRSPRKLLSDNTVRLFSVEATSDARHDLAHEGPHLIHPRIDDLPDDCANFVFMQFNVPVGTTPRPRLKIDVFCDLDKDCERGQEGSATTAISRAFTPKENKASTPTTRLIAVST